MILAAGQAVPLKMDVDRKDVAPIAIKYKVSAIPALFVLDADGKVVATVETTLAPARFAAQLERILKKHMPGAAKKPGKR